MKYLFAFCLFLICSCKDSEPPEFNRHDAAQLNGFWFRDTNPDWTYLFNLWPTTEGSQGNLLVRRIDFGAEIVRNEYAVRTRGDSVFLKDIHDGGERIWVVEFLNDSMCRVDENYGSVLWFPFPIKKF